MKTENYDFTQAWPTLAAKMDDELVAHINELPDCVVAIYDPKGNAARLPIKDMPAYVVRFICNADDSVQIDSAFLDSYLAGLTESTSIPARHPVEIHQQIVSAVIDCVRSLLALSFPVEPYEINEYGFAVRARHTGKIKAGGFTNTAGFAELYGVEFVTAFERGPLAVPLYIAAGLMVKNILTHGVLRRDQIEGLLELHPDVLENIEEVNIIKASIEEVMALKPVLYGDTVPEFYEVLVKYKDHEYSEPMVNQAPIADGDEKQAIGVVQVDFARKKTGSNESIVMPKLLYAQKKADGTLIAFCNDFIDSRYDVKLH
jgi:hypothetical protein